MTRVAQFCQKDQQYSNICTGTGCESTPFPGKEGGSENWVFCCLSCKHALGSYPFPLPFSSPLSHKSGSTESLPKISYTTLDHSPGKFQPELKVRALASHFRGMDSKGSIKMKK
jgi:hypothetical protein